MKPILCAALALALAGRLILPVYGAETGEAANVSAPTLVTAHSGFSSVNMLFDTYTITPVDFEDGASITLLCPEGIGSLYLIFDLEYGVFTVTDPDSGESIDFGENRFLHAFADLEEAFGFAPTSVEITFGSGTGALNEIYVFTPGTPPDFVQIWETPKDGATDIVLFSTHGDDEQLFFAGLLPYYAGELGYRVQVVYLTDHRNLTNVRVHEMLNGLWAVGVTAYPVFGSYPDILTKSANETRLLFQSRGITEDEVLGFVVENIRRFRPQVAIGHDLNGEYGHGQHMLYAELLTQAVQISDDPEQYPDTAEAYGTWDVPKTYLHLYPENTIYMDWDRPLDSFGGMTAFQVTQQLGFPCHESQYWDFAWFLSYAESAASIRAYSPCEYGLYRSTVGPDVERSDLMENLISYARQEEEAEAARLAAEEEARRLEAARLEAERKAEEERLKQEEEDRRAEEEQLLLQQEIARREQQRKDRLTQWGLVGILTVLLLLGTVIAVIDRHK